MALGLVPRPALLPMGLSREVTLTPPSSAWLWLKGCGGQVLTGPCVRVRLISFTVAASLSCGLACQVSGSHLVPSEEPGKRDPRAVGQVQTGVVHPPRAGSLGVAEPTLEMPGQGTGQRTSRGCRWDKEASKLTECGQVEATSPRQL